MGQRQACGRGTDRAFGETVIRDHDMGLGELSLERRLLPCFEDNRKPP